MNEFMNTLYGNKQETKEYYEDNSNEILSIATKLNNILEEFNDCRSCISNKQLADEYVLNYRKLNKLISKHKINKG